VVVPGGVVLYGPQTPGQAVTATGPNPNIGAHSLEGNIMACWPDNPNLTMLTAIPNPRLRDPYVMSWFSGVQREIRRDLVMDVNNVGTAGRKLIRAEDWNRFTGDRSGAESPTGECAGDASWNRINQTYGTLRFWENSVNPGAGPFKIPTTNPDGIPSTDERVAFFGQPEPGTNGTLGRNTYEGPGFANLDFSLFKSFKIKAINEESRIQLRFELFNTFNRVNFRQPSNVLDDSLFGRAGSAFDARQIQFGLKFIF